MPLYEYRCHACGQRFEVIQKFSDPNPETCRICGKGPVERLMSSPAFQFKGSGWYITDYAQKGKSSESGDGAKTDKGESSAAGDSAKSDTATSDSAAKSESTTKSDSASKTTKSESTTKSDSGSSTTKS
jgi:putative FmdB family regulatory protein